MNATTLPVTARKARARAIPCDPQRWPPCVRCGLSYQRSRIWPEGRICQYCHDAARHRQGHCVGCGHEGVLPGIDPAGEPTCVSCSGIPVKVHCRSCDQEAPMGRGNRCWRCQLRELVTTLLTGPDGTIPDRLAPLADALITMPRPNSGYAWLRSNPRVRELLAHLADGQVELSHDALDGLPGSATVEYLRGLLVAHGCLPPRDPHLAGYERWLAAKLPQIVDPAQRQLIDRFARWHLLRRLRRHARDEGAVPTGTFLNAKQSTTVAIAFLAWLDQRGAALEIVTQHDLDAWFATGPSTRKHAVRFLYWAQDQRLLRNVQVRAPSTGNGPALGPTQRLEHLRRVLLDRAMQPAHRLVAVLVLLFGQSLSKIVRLTLDDVIVNDDRVLLRLGGDGVELPEPVAALVTAFLADPRYRRNTAANRDARWLFPGIKPGQPLHLQSARRMLHQAGIPPLAARTGTWLQLVREAPPAVLADALGVNANTVMRYAALAGTNFLTYPAARTARPAGN